MNRVPHGSAAPEFAAQSEAQFEAQFAEQFAEQPEDGHDAQIGNGQTADSGFLNSSAVEWPAVGWSAGATAIDPPQSEVPNTEAASAVQPPDSTLLLFPPASPSGNSAVLALPPVRFLGKLLNQHPTIFWSGVWVITLLCAGIAVTGLMNPELSSQQEQPDPTGVEAVLRATRLDRQRSASPAVSFGLLAVSCAGCCLLLSRRFQQPQSLAQPMGRRKLRSPARSTIAAELEAIATLASDSIQDPERLQPLPSRQPWMDAALSAANAESAPAPPTSHASGSLGSPGSPGSLGSQLTQVLQAPQSQDYLSYLRVHAQSRAQSQRTARTEGRSPSRPQNSRPQNDPASPHTIAPYAPNPALPVAFLLPSAHSLPENAFLPAPIAQPTLPAATQPLLNLSQPPQSQAESLPDPASTLAELRKIQAKRARKETEL